MNLVLTMALCLVQSSAFRRRIAVFHPGRLKAGRQTGIGSDRCPAKGGQA